MPPSTSALPTASDRGGGGKGGVGWARPDALRKSLLTGQAFNSGQQAARRASTQSKTLHHAELLPSVHAAASLAGAFTKERSVRVANCHECPTPASVLHVVNDALDEQIASLEETIADEEGMQQKEASSYATAHLQQWLLQAQERAIRAEQAVAAVRAELEFSHAETQAAKLGEERAQAALRSTAAETESLRSTCKALAASPRRNEPWPAVLPPSAAADAVHASPEPAESCAHEGPATEALDQSQPASPPQEPPLQPPLQPPLPPPLQPQLDETVETSVGEPPAADETAEAHGVRLRLRELHTSLALSAAICGETEAGFDPSLDGGDGELDGAPAPLIAELRTHLMALATKGGGGAGLRNSERSWHARAARGWNSHTALHAAALAPAVVGHLRESHCELEAGRNACADLEAALQASRWQLACVQAARASERWKRRCWAGWAASARAEVRRRLVERYDSAQREALEAYVSERQLRMNAEGELNAMRNGAIGSIDTIQGVDPPVAVVHTRRPVGMPAWRTSPRAASTDEAVGAPVGDETAGAAAAAETSAADAEAGETLSGEMRARCEQVFSRLDQNRDGRLSRIEIIQACRQDATVAHLLRVPLSVCHEEGSRDVIEGIFQATDGDESSITLDEFHRFWVCEVMPRLGAPAAPDATPQQRMRRLSREVLLTKADEQGEGPTPLRFRRLSNDETDGRRS